MKCGFFELDITPKMGSIIPGGFAARYANEIYDRLFVRVFVSENGTESLALAVIDACGITIDITENVRRKVSEKTPIKAQNVMVMATHTHGGGPTLNWGEEVVRDPEYLEFIAQRTADAITFAWNNRADSQLLFGREELCDVSFIRDYEMKGGRLKTNPEPYEKEDIIKPCTTIDPELLVLGVKQDGKYVGAVVNFANHPATLAENKTTGDYISELSLEMKRIYGEDFVTLFINGACGNINHINPFDSETLKDDRYRTVGRKIAEKANSAMSKAVIMKDEGLRSESETISVRLRKPGEKQLVEAKKLFESLGDNLINSTPDTPDYMETFFALQCFWIMSDKRTQREVYLQCFKIGDIYIAGTPAQLFVEFGKAIKKNCGAPCFVSAFANDYCGYVPTPECMREGIYEARLATTSCLEAAAGEKIVAGVSELLEKIK